MSDIDLGHHGDRDALPGLVDLAVNVRTDAPPAWLRQELADSLTDLARYPDQSAARTAVAERHGREPAEVLLTAGAAEAFVLLARTLRPRHAVVVHPQFTEPEAALRSAGHAVDRVVLDWPYTLDPDRIPADADLVVIGNPTNPTSILHPAATLATLARRGRTLVVDEAFADCIPGEPESLAGQRIPGLVVLRSLTKTWGLAGLRCGYLLAPPDLVATLAAAQPLWPVSTPALVACIACSRPTAITEADAWALNLADDRSALLTELGRHAVTVVPDPAASFVLFRHQSDGGVRERLAGKGFAVRRGDTFPGLGPSWLRVAVRDPETTAAFGAALGAVL